MSFLFTLATQIFTWLWQSLTEPFVWGSWGERETDKVRERERKGEKKGGKGTQQRPYVQCDPHYSQLGQPSMEWSC